jgi:hypothetical protein
MKSWHIPNPCAESWGRMQPAEQGRFCSVCQTQVLDCTSMSNEDIVALAKTAAGKLCIRALDEKQATTSSNENRKVLPLRQMVAAAAIMTSFTTSYAAKSNGPDICLLLDHEHNGLAMEDTNRYVLRGVVCDSLTHDVLPYAVVCLKGQRMGIVTDEKGQFELVLPDSALSEVVHLEVHYVGFKSKFIDVRKDQFIEPLWIELSNEQVFITVGTIVVDKRAAKKSRQRTRFNSRRSEKED